MAQRRMFSPKIVDTDIFLDMPVSARELYFQLGMHADDDGFITPKKILRMLGASDDDLKILIAKTFVIPFNSGVVVITCWKVNNLIRKDWYQETIYKEEKEMLSIDSNGKYFLVNEMLPNSLTEVRLGKVNIYKNISSTQSVEHVQIEQTFERFWDAYPRHQGKKPALLKWKRCYKHLENIISDIEYRLTHNQTESGWIDDKTGKLINQNYIPLPSTYLNQERWEDEIS